MVRSLCQYQYFLFYVFLKYSRTKASIFSGTLSCKVSASTHIPFDSLISTAGTEDYAMPFCSFGTQSSVISLCLSLTLW